VRVFIASPTFVNLTSEINSRNGDAATSQRHDLSPFRYSKTFKETFGAGNAASGSADVVVGCS
jgi:hypothetical protein